jgi:hypothetical protein
MANKKRQQTIAKRNRERAIEEKRTLKRLAKQEKREALRSGEPLPDPTEQDHLERQDSVGESPPDPAEPDQMERQDSVGESPPDPAEPDHVERQDSETHELAG